MRPLAFCGALLLSFSFGSIHAFGVLLRPLETQLGASRMAASAGYSAALVCLTVAVLLSPRILPRFTPAWAAAITGLAAMSGLLIAAVAASSWVFIMGYGLMFGFSNGLAYVLFLDQAEKAMPKHSGVAAGTVTAVYGLGAASFAPLLAWVVSTSGLSPALALLGVAAGITGIAASLTFKGNLALAPNDLQGAARLGRGPWILRLWLVYLLAATGSLMIIAHAEALTSWAGATDREARLAPILAAVGNIAGSLAGGSWSQGRPPRSALVPVLMLSVLSLVGLLAAQGPVSLLAAMFLAGLAYGALIVAVPVVVRQQAGASGFGQAFARVFTAWGIAGLVGPSMGSALYVLLSSYSVPLIAALLAAGMALALCWHLGPSPASSE